MTLTNLIDHHFHFNFQDSDNQHARLQQAFNNGLTYALESGTSLSHFEQRLALAKQYKGKVWLTAGIHPEGATLQWNKEIEQMLITQLMHPLVLALGEIGLDYSYPMDKNQQQTLFANQLQLLKKINKPVMLHLRDAHNDALAIIKEHNITKGVVHCFTGNQAVATQWLNQNFYLSFSGITTFKNATDIKESAGFCPLNRLFCETDAPWLTPVPYRGQSNQVAYVYYVYHEVAKLKALPLEELALQITNNFTTLYAV